ncbi:PREDICTED: myoD family inhibitor [Corvus brachyrhynchos]|uniref:myoD family inhibitor n=1 Tax=Corvus brachyrhynchos TaxID=85066 RepID=UPI0008167599|nr:PREDICTED: myoD family inhibitor [Corvus brachyrhynchos]
MALHRASPPSPDTPWAPHIPRGMEQPAPSSAEGGPAFSRLSARGGLAPGFLPWGRTQLLSEVAEPSRPPPRPIPAVPPAEPRPPARPAVPKKEKPPEDDKSPKVLTKSPRAELCGAPEAVTCQPQVRTPPQPPGPCTHLLHNGAGRGPEPGGANGEAGNGMCRAVPSSQKPHRKLQSHHSINSQSSKKSKGSSKSASSHIPIEAQEASGEWRDCTLPCDMDCGIIDACCESADCLEICMECCGLCFSS